MQNKLTASTKPTATDTKKHLLLDLDETLISSAPKRTSLPKIYIKVRYQGKEILFPDVVKRPGLEAFLSTLKEHYHLHIFTSSLKEYAHAVVNDLGIAHYFEKIFTRDHCININGIWVKDISFLPFPPTSMILVDDLVAQVQRQPFQTILIDRFEGDAMDSQLANLTPFLTKIATVRDVRTVCTEYSKYLKTTQTPTAVPTKKKANTQIILLPVNNEEVDIQRNLLPHSSVKNSRLFTLLGSGSVDSDLKLRKIQTEPNVSPLMQETNVVRRLFTRQESDAYCETMEENETNVETSATSYLMKIRSNKILFSTKSGKKSVS